LHASASDIPPRPVRRYQHEPVVLTPAVSEQAVFRPLAAITLVGVLVLSFIPSEAMDPLRLNIDDSIDITHIVAYALLVATTMLSLPSQALTFWRGAAIVVAISLLGIAIELLQPIVGRTTSVVDFAENEIGIAGGIALFWAYRQVGRARNGGAPWR
jgi:VanZ family protein